MIIAPPIDRSSAIPVQDLTLNAQRRAAIDTLATTRATVIRCGLFGTYLFRQNPNTTDGEEVRQSWVAEMEIQYGFIARACALVGGRDPTGEFPQEICAWLAHCTRNNAEEVAILNEMLRLTGKLIDTTLIGGRSLEKMLIEHAVYGRTPFFDAVSILCDVFWIDIDQKRHAEVQRAQENDVALGVTLKRLEHIGRHVRLVSLNASVEAARVGDTGKGLGVIAQEFKSLAEEIQHLAHSARENTRGAEKLEK